MSYSIIYTSQTQNTKMLAEKIQQMLPDATLMDLSLAQTTNIEADFLFIGFWTDKGSCSLDMVNFLKTIEHKTIFLFGTAGFKADQSYYQQIIHRVSSHLSPTNTLVGSFICQGKMPESVLHRYEKMENIVSKDTYIKNFYEASLHPNAEDLLHLNQHIMTII